MTAINLTAQPNISDVAKKLEELREAAKMAVSGIAGDINAMETFFDALNKKIQDNKHLLQEIVLELTLQENQIESLEQQIANAEIQLASMASADISNNQESSVLQALRTELSSLQADLQQVKTAYDNNIRNAEQYARTISTSLRALKFARAELAAYQNAQTGADTPDVSTHPQITDVRSEMAKPDTAGQSDSAHNQALQTPTAQSDDKEKEYTEHTQNSADASAAGKVEIEGNANKKREQEESAWNEHLIKYGTFREQFQATKDKYDKLIAEAKNEGEKKSFEAERDAELAELEIAMSEWAQGLINTTIDELERLAKEAKKQLTKAQDAFDSLESSDTPEAKTYLQTINSLKAKIALLESKTKDAKEAATDKDWKKGTQLLDEISSTAREAAGALGKLDEGLNKIATFIATLASTAKNLITTIQGVTAASSAAGASLSAMETASVVLAAISAAFQILQAVFSLFSQTDSIEETRQAFAELNDEIAHLKREAAIDSLEGTIFGNNAYANAVNNMKVAIEALERYKQILETIRHQGNSDSATEAIINMRVQTRHSTWFRAAKYDALGDLLPDLFNEDGQLNIDALKEFQGSDLYNKISKQNRDLIDKLIDDWELYEEAIKAVRDHLSEIFGDLGNTMADTLVDAFANGTDAAKAFTDSVSDMLENLAKQMILSAFLTPIFEKAQKQLEGAMAEDLTDESRFAKFAEIMGSLTSEALTAQDNIFATLEAFEKAAQENGIDLFKGDSAEAQSISDRGFQAMSQETGNELTGRFSDMQSKVSDIRDYVLMVTANGSQQLNETINIRDIMIQLRGDVADIRGYTQVLPTMSNTLTSMNRKLDNL